MGNGRDHRDYREQPVSWRSRWSDRRHFRWRFRWSACRRWLGLAAVTRPRPAPRAPRPPAIFGPDVMLVRDRALLVISEKAQPGVPPAVLRIPMESCVAARLAVEPGLPGAELLQLTLTVRLGRTALVELPVRFPAPCQIFLQRLVDEVTARAVTRDSEAPPEPQGTAASAALVLEPLPVRRAPDTHDWITFRAGDDGEVLHVCSDDEAVRDGGQG